MEDSSFEAKLKLLRLYRYLFEETDEKHPVSRTQLALEMVKMGYGAQLRVVTDDIDLMNRAGFPVQGCFNGHERFFYIGDRLFTDPELKIILDALQAATFLSPAKTRRFSEKLALLAGKKAVPDLLKKRSLFTTHKCNNEALLYSIATLNEAIDLGVQVSFCYFDLNYRAERAYRKNGERYTVEPLAVVFQDENFYLMTWNSKYSNYCNYRVDRMDRVRPEKEPITPAALTAKEAMPPEKYTSQAFHMYNGELADVTLQVAPAAFNRFFDRFGTDAKLTPLNNGLYEANVSLQVSPEFFAWVFRFCGDIQIAAPSDLAEEYRLMALKAAGLSEPEPEVCETGSTFYLFPEDQKRIHKTVGGTDEQS